MVEHSPCKQKDPRSMPRMHVDKAKCGGMCLQSQHWVGGDRQIPRPSQSAILAYTEDLGTIRDPVSKHKKKGSKNQQLRVTSDLYTCMEALMCAYNIRYMYICTYIRMHITYIHTTKYVAIYS